MLDGEIEAQDPDLPIIKQILGPQLRVTPDRGGLVHPVVPVGTWVEQGQVVVLIRDPWGDVIEEITFNGNYFDAVAQEVRRVKSIAERYTGRKPNVIERVATKVVMAMLRRFSHRGEASSELGCFGLFIRAKRLDQAPAALLEPSKGAA